MTNWTLARRAERMNPSVIREILKVTEKPGIISLAGSGAGSHISRPALAVRGKLGQYQHQHNTRTQQ